jgi:peptidoglycan/xylan/chitin deacetylase (PgdA/CDA1 family)
VAAHGAASYFDRPGWRRQLRAVFDAQRGISGGGRFETGDEQRDALRKSLRESRRLLEERLGKRVLDLAYPWGVGGELAAALSREAGYRTNYHVTLPGRSSNVRNHDPFRIVRLKDDYIVRLPGAGRRSLGRVILEKFRRRLGSRDIY